MITTKLLIYVFFLLNSLLQVLGHYDRLNTTSSWLENHKDKPEPKPKPPMCKPWICKKSGPPMSRMRCCRKQCVDVFSDPNHCRFCFKSCRFGLSCCDGDCVDTNNDPSNCGECRNECEPGAPCEFGMCGYAAAAAPDPSSQPPGKPKRHRHPKHRRPHPPPSPDGNFGGKVLYDDRDDE